MSLRDAIHQIMADRPIRGGSALGSHPQGRCYYCLGDGYGEPHQPDCPMLAMPKILGVLEQCDLMLDSMARVWGKAERHEREGYKEYVEMGDILYHATDGQRGRCGGYDGPPCEREEVKA
jgi:hypothetical protein